MRFLRLLLVVLGLSGLILGEIGSASQVQAAPLTQAQVRLSRNKNTTAPGSILVIAETSDVASEDEVEVQVGSAWSIDSSAAAFTVSTSNLPSGVTAWPGIQTASNVTGNTITFPSSDLTPNTAYGFYITGGIPTNPAAGTGLTYTWTISTLAASSTISSTLVGVPIVADDQVIITAAIEPLANAFEADLALISDHHTLSANEEMEYEITYSSAYTQATPLTLQVEWTQGTIDGNVTPTVDIVEYVLGSAGTAYGSTSPIIDLENQTITWEISSFPAPLSDQTVRFKLKTTSVTNSKDIDFQVKARIIEPTTTGHSIISHIYYYSPPPPSPVPSPTPTPTPTPSTTSVTTSPSPTETSTNTAKPDVTSVSFQTITPSSVSVDITTDQSTGVIIRYGLSPDALTQTYTSTSLTPTQLITLTGLLPGTTYYFTIEPIDGSGSTSDIFTFTTATQESEVQLESRSLIISANGAQLATDREIANPFITIVSELPHEISFRLSQTASLQSVSLIFRPLEARDGQVPREYIATETSPGVYSVKLNKDIALGTYQVSVQLRDIYGNLSEKTLTRLAVVLPITVVDSRSLRGIHDAQVLIKQFNTQTKLFEPIIPGNHLSTNPVTTTADGFALASLPPGKYLIHVSTPGYHDQEVEFEITLNQAAAYPYIKLEKAPFQFGTFVGNLQDTLKDFTRTTTEFVKPWGASVRFFNLINTLVIVTFVVLSPIAYLTRRWILPVKTTASNFQTPTVIQVLLNMSKRGVGVFLDVWTVSLSGLELLFMFAQGWLPAGIFFIVSLINIGLWQLCLHWFRRHSLK